MLQSIRETISGVMQILARDGVYKIPDRSIVLELPVSYARKSADDYTEINTELYPQTIIYDYAPEFDVDWNPNFYKRIDRYRNFVNNNPSSVPLEASSFEEPMRLVFKFDVTIYLKDPIQRYAVMDFMLRQFGKQGRFTLNKVEMPEGDLGDFITYYVTPSEVGRTDGIAELNYSFTMKAFVVVADEQEVDLISNFVLNPNPINP